MRPSCPLFMSSSEEYEAIARCRRRRCRYLPPLSFPVMIHLHHQDTSSSVVGIIVIIIDQFFVCFGQGFYFYFLIFFIDTYSLSKIDCGNNNLAFEYDNDNDGRDYRLHRGPCLIVYRLRPCTFRQHF